MKFLRPKNKIAKIAKGVIYNLTHRVKYLYITIFGSVSGKRYVEENTVGYENIQFALDEIDDRWGDDIKKSDDEPVFLFSAGWRAGSTLLQRMIMKDGAIEVWGEPFNRSNLIQTMMAHFLPFSKKWPRDYHFADYFDGPKVDKWIAATSPSVPSLVASHIQFFQNLFKPANGKRWGVKEVRCEVQHAQYLKWLFPKAKFIFLYRNPYDSYASFKNYLVYDFSGWPHKPVIKARDFARHWAFLTRDFLDNAHKVDGISISYEDLKLPETSKKLTNYLGIRVPLLSEMSTIRGVDQSKKALRNRTSDKHLSRLERFIMNRELGELAHELAYY